MRLTQRNTVCLYFMTEFKNPNKTDLQVCEAISLLTMCIKLCCSRKYPYSPHKGFFGLKPPSLWKFLFRLIFSFKSFDLLRTPLPLRISNDPLWWIYGYFLEPHILPKCTWKKESFCFLGVKNV